jgi:hypothetical protein
LATELKNLRREQVRVTAVIVSSMGAIYGPSLKDLQKVLRCNDKEMRKVAKKMSETVIVGSMDIWRQGAKQIKRGVKDDVNELIREEIERIEQAGVETEAEVEAVMEENEDGLGDRRDDDAEDEDLGLLGEEEE